MENHDIITLIIAMAAFLAPIIGPIITAVLTNQHESYMYKKRFVTEHEHEAIERYLKAAGRFVFSFGSTAYYEFGEAASEIFMYAPKELWEDIQKFNKNIADNAPSNHINGGVKSEIKSVMQSDYLSLCEKFSNYSRSSKRRRRQ